MEGREPVGGQWNFDKENRKSFGKRGPSGIPEPYRPAPDALTQVVIQEVGEHFPNHPGSLDDFRWAVTRDDALKALDVFIRTRLPSFGDHQDAMWTGEPFLSHSLISPALNLKLLDPREVVGQAESAYREGLAPLASVEGFIRQVLGWREFIRGAYFLEMPQLKEANHFDHRRPLPAWYWTGQTRMRCLSDAITTTLKHGYAHHIQRLMVTGLFGLTAEIEPQAVADWYLAVYLDAVEWVELPNVMGMALFANGGRFTTKPYAASGAYIKRMSNYCTGCPYSPEERVGEQACPLTVLYWNFIDRHEATLGRDPRTSLMVKNLQRMNDSERQTLRDDAQRLLSSLDTL
jgi:deoxyribodipyrimidine photolyase-related protein